MGWTLFGVVWGLASLGVTLKIFNRLSHPLWSTGLYLAMGWLVWWRRRCLPACRLTPALAAGGRLAYTAASPFS